MDKEELTQKLQLQKKKIKDPPIFDTSQEVWKQGVIDRNQSTSKLKTECLIKAQQALATPHSHQKLTNNAFKNVFGFQKRETKTFKNAESQRKYESRLVKNFERKVLRQFIRTSKLDLEHKRSVTMSFGIFFKYLIKPIPIEIQQEIYLKMKDMGQFIGPYFETELTSNKEPIDVFIKKMIVEFYFFYKLRDLLSGVCENNLEQTLKFITLEQRKDERPLQFIENFWSSPNSSFDDQLRLNSSPSQDQHISQINSPNHFLEDSVNLVNPEIRDSSSISFSMEIFDN